MKKSNINEEDKSKFRIHVDAKTLKNTTMTKKMADIQNANPYIEFDMEPTKDGNIPTMEDLAEDNSVLEPEALITPQDKTTIKYLSNVKDSKTGEISQPFTIGAQKYQMVRGTCDNQIVMAVFAHDETDELGENIIYSIDEFEKNIALPMLETMGLRGQDIGMVGDEPMTDVKDDTYEGYKHYLVNKETNEVRKFKTIEEMLSSDKLDTEEYMGVGKFKKHMNEKLFGSKKRNIEPLNEVTPTGEESDEEMNIKAKKLMDMIGKRIPNNIIKTITTPVAQREVIAAFAELIGVPRNGLNKLIMGLKVLAKQETTPVAESKVMTKNELMESLKKHKIIKTIKIKDIK